MKKYLTKAGIVAAISVFSATSFVANAAVAFTSTSGGNTDVPFPFSLGYVFTLNQDMYLNALGQFDVAGNGTVSTAKVALFNWDTGNLITEIALTGGALEETGVYDTYFVNIPSILLTVGVNYFVATEVGANDFAYGSNIMSVDSNVVWLAGRASPVGSPSMPSVANMSTFSIERTSEAAGSYFGPNMKLTAVPEPSSAILLGIGLGSVFFSRRRRH